LIFFWGIIDGTLKEVIQVEARLDRIEDMVGQLIQMVAVVMEDQKEMKSQIKSLQEGQQALRKDIDKLRTDVNVLRKDVDVIRIDLNEFRTEQKSSNRNFNDQFQLIRADMDHIWGKTVNNERKIAIMEKKMDFEY